FDINIQELAKESVQNLLGILKATKIKSQKVIIPFKLIERESV
ncbi:MAG: LacI family transcriptional regulator, partial [Streptococcus salivarius]